MTKSTVSFGSISHGTLKSSDLIITFYDELKFRNLNKDFDKTDSGIIVAGLNLINDEDVWDAFEGTDRASEIMEELEELLSEGLPPYCYFGAHSGDGSDYGYWFDSGAFEYAVQDGEVLKVATGTDVKFRKLDPEVQYVAFVSDHGNLELYTRTGRYLYGVV